MTDHIAEKYAVFPYGNTNPSTLDKRLTALLREVAEIRQELYTAPRGNPELRMHHNMPAAIGNLGVDLNHLVRDHAIYWEESEAEAILASGKTR